MKMARFILVTVLFFNLVIVPSIAFPFGNGYGFDKPKEGFYSGSCPNAEKIVADALAEIVKMNPNAVANLLRLQFHDCFVVGCDASILLDYSPTGEQVEKSSFFNGQLLKGADIVDDIKSKLEEQCPGVVSCSDTLAFAINEGMVLAGLPRRAPLGGRRDSVYSLASVVENNNLPMPGWPIERMVELFTRKGFTIEEMVILIGAHSVGSVHCDIFMERIYNFANTRKPDPTLPAPVINEFQQVCKNAGTPQFRNPPVNFDETPTVLDTLFFKNMVNRNKTTILTDSHLINDPRTIPIVQQMANEDGLWQQRFPEVMDKMSSLNVLTGNNGEVRKTCRSTN
ncbi:peroxidase [Trifolium repens]|nr:peroxidase [Trifolium repens]